MEFIHHKQQPRQPKNSSSNQPKGKDMMFSGYTNKDVRYIVKENSFLDCYDGSDAFELRGYRLKRPQG